MSVSSQTTTLVPTAQELVRRAADLVPLLRKNAFGAEQARRIQDETIEALADAGLLRLRVPQRYGGYESDAKTLNDVLVQLGRGDGAVSWTVSVWAIPGWMVGMFPDAVQDEVYATPNVRVCGTLSPTGSARPADGGLVVDGSWGFISGALHSHWQEVIAMAPTPDGAGLWPVVALVPMRDLRIVDDWHTSGMCGSGSVTTVAENVFVPSERIMPLVSILQGSSSSPRSAELPLYRNPLLGVANNATSGVLVGMAAGAYEAFLERMAGRKISYTDYPSQADAPITHIQVGEAAMAIDEAAFHADRIASVVDGAAAEGRAWTVAERARSRADIGAICRLARQAVEVLSAASGGSSIYSHVPIQKIARDLHAASMHALITPSTNYELYGRVLCGLEPNTQYI